MYDRYAHLNCAGITLGFGFDIVLVKCDRSASCKFESAKCDSEVVRRLLSDPIMVTFMVGHGARFGLV